MRRVRFRRRLTTAFASETTRDRVLAMAWGSGSGFVRPGGRAGVVLCALIAGHPQPAFRFVELDDDLQLLRRDGEPVVDDDLLARLVAADPGDDETPGTLTDDLRATAFEAWEAARSDIGRSWERRRDPASSGVEVPKVMRDAAQHVRDHGFDLGDRQDDVVKRLGQPVLARVQREVRAILREHQGDPVAGAVALADAVVDLRSLVPVHPDPLPRIDPDTDIHLVTWVVVLPEPR